MKKSYYKLYFLILLSLLFSGGVVRATDFTTTVNFPAHFEVGDYVEFAKLNPIDAGASGFYEISISYARGYIAAAATHYVAVSHVNADVWREAGRVNSNHYTTLGYFNFTIDCNTGPTRNLLRVRAVNTFGVKESAIDVHIKIRSINFDVGINPLNIRGKESNPVKLLPMTEEWDLYVGSLSNSESAHIAIKALANGNVGIGTATPNEKLAVNGNIRAKEIKVEATNWPDYVFKQDYQLMPLKEVEQHILQHGHLPDIPKAEQIEKEGLSVSEMNKLMMKKIEELTLHLIEKDKLLEAQQTQFENLNKKVLTIERKLDNEK